MYFHPSQVRAKIVIDCIVDVYIERGSESYNLQEVL